MDFTWYPAIHYSTERPPVHNNLQFKLLHVLFNLATLYCHLGFSTNSHTGLDGIKAWANYYSLAASILSHMKVAVLPKLRMSIPPEDMDDATLESLMQLMFAQSRKYFWQKALRKDYKNSIIAKPAARLSDLDHLAAESAKKKSESICSVWTRHISAKHHHSAAAAQYRLRLIVARSSNTVKRLHDFEMLSRARVRERGAQGEPGRAHDR